MKKEYTKPFLAVESFQLDAAVAGACKENGVAINHTLDTCVLEGAGLFGGACGIYDVTQNPQLCYQAMADGLYLQS